MAVANAYTFVQAEGDGSIMVELALKESSRRVRCKLLYSAPGGDEGERTLQRLAIVRETLDGSGTFSEGCVSSQAYRVIE